MPCGAQAQQAEALPALRRKMRAANLGIHFYGESSARPLRKLTWIPRR